MQRSARFAFVLADAQTGSAGFALIISEKGGAERRQVFRSGEVTIGRIAGNDLVLPKGNVSKRHARLLFREGRLLVTDLNSTNGTFVNRRRISQATIIREEDRLFIGDYVLRIETAAALDSGPLDTSEQIAAPPLQSLRPSIPSPVPGEPETAAVALTLPPMLDRGHDEPRHSSGPPARMSEAPPEPSATSQRALDAAVTLRAVVTNVTELVVKRRGGEPPLVVTAEVAAEVTDAVNNVVDQLLVDGGIPVGISAESVADMAGRELIDLGVLRPLLEDPGVFAIGAARYDDLVESRDERRTSGGVGFSHPDAARRALMRLCAERGEPVSPNELFVERSFSDGVRLSASLGDAASSGPVFVIRKPRRLETSLDDLVRRGALSRAMATFLAHCVTARLNVLVTGPQDEGKHLIMSALCGSAGRDRIVTVSDVDDFGGKAPGAVRISLDRAGAEARRVLQTAASVPSSRLAVYMPSPEVALMTLEAMSLGSGGVFASLPSGNLERALRRWPADLAAWRPGLGVDAAAAWIESSFDIAIEVARLRDGRVRVLRIAELGSDSRGTLTAADLFCFSVTRVLAAGAIEGTFSPTGTIPRAVAQMQALGTRVDAALFSRPASR